MNKTLKLLLVFALGLLTTISEISAQDFPKGPELSMTPGKLCEFDQKRRYPEQINYCVRDVAFELKEIIMTQYDEKFGYHIKSLPREDIKIDHFIPLCMGGSNDISNLWPQHKSIYAVTDPLEPFLCDLMAQGVLKQSEAVSYMIRAKTNVEETKKIIQELSR